MALPSLSIAPLPIAPLPMALPSLSIAPLPIAPLPMALLPIANSVLHYSRSLLLCSRFGKEYIHVARKAIHVCDTYSANMCGASCVLYTRTHARIDKHTDTGTGTGTDIGATWHRNIHTCKLRPRRRRGCKDHTPNRHDSGKKIEGDKNLPFSLSSAHAHSCANFQTPHTHTPPSTFPPLYSQLPCTASRASPPPATAQTTSKSRGFECGPRLCATPSLFARARRGEETQFRLRGAVWECVVGMCCEFATLRARWHVDVSVDIRHLCLAEGAALRTPFPPPVLNWEWCVYVCFISTCLCVVYEYLCVDLCFLLVVCFVWSVSVVMCLVSYSPLKSGRGGGTACTVSIACYICIYICVYIYIHIFVVMCLCEAW